MAYATIADLQARTTRRLTEEEQSVAEALLEDAAAMIDAAAGDEGTNAGARRTVSCRMVLRALGDGGLSGVPIGATQGSMSAIGYNQQWTIPAGGATGELYLSKSDRTLLGLGNRIGSYSPVQALTPDGGLPS